MLSAASSSVGVAVRRTGMSLAVCSGMARVTQPIWPSDDQIREQEGDRAFTKDGRKVRDSERVGGMAPDIDPEHPTGEYLRCA